MTTNAVPTHAHTFNQPGFSITGFFMPVVEYAGVWINTCADYWAAAAMYEQLSGLSDDALQRRGLSRANLARDICAFFEKSRAG